jgi:adenylate kinase
MSSTACKRPRPSALQTSRSFLTSNHEHDTNLTQHAQSISITHQSFAEFHTSPANPFYTHDTKDHIASQSRPGSIAFGECEINALSDLFLQFAKTSNSVDDTGPYLNFQRIKQLLESVGEKPDDITLQTLFEQVNLHKDGKLRLDCFLRAADSILGTAPARIVLIVGGPGSGKGALCSRLERECGVVHLSCGEMLREEVEAQTPLGREVADIMSSGGLVSSAVVTALMRRRMRQHPGRRILLDGFPRSLENARDFVELCGPPELALHLDCDDCILLERILERGGKSAKEAEMAAVEGRGRTVNVRADDNVHTAIQRLKNYHKHHKPTMDWLKSIKVPIVELDCSGTKEDVWQQLMAIGRLMRPAVKIPPVGQIQQQQSQDLQWFA